MSEKPIRKRQLCKIKEDTSPKISVKTILDTDWVFVSFRCWDKLAQVPVIYPRFRVLGAVRIKSVVAMPKYVAEIYLAEKEVSKFRQHDIGRLVTQN